MKVLVFGRDGLLGSDMLKGLSADPAFEVSSFNHQEFDITDFSLVRDSLPKVDVLVNCTGERQVDEAEGDRKGMFEVNMKGVRNLAAICKRNGILLVHFSTHYVFDGEKQKKYSERDIPNPLNIYGASKLAGDMEVRGIGGSYLIIRSQSLFGSGAPCFVNDLITRLRANEPIGLPDDEIIAPTYTVHLSRAVATLIKLGKKGLVNVAAAGEASRLGVATFLAGKLGSTSKLIAVKSRDLKRPAKRPLYSVLDSHWFKLWTGANLPDWKEGLEEYLRDRGL
jgi:dTDP-4-dehydrorhamnose reductase